MLSYNCFIMLIITILKLTVCDINLKLNSKQAWLGEHLIYKELGRNLDKFRVNLQLSLTKSDGMVFYAVDNTKNQYVVRLSKNILTIEVNKDYHEYLLEDICDSREIEFRRLNITVDIHGDVMGVGCNGRKFSFNQRKYNINSLETTYPTLVNAVQTARHFYFINVPDITRGGYIYSRPNYKQLEGCLHKIVLDNKEILPTIITSEKRSLDNDNFKKCKVTCDKSPCKSENAECLEYFDTKIQKCSCFKSEMNGELCDQRLKLKKSYVYSHEGNIDYPIHKFKFSVNITKLNKTNFDEDANLLNLYKTADPDMNVTVKLSSSLNYLSVKLNNDRDLNVEIGYDLLGKFIYGIYIINLQFYRTSMILQMVHRGKIVLGHKIIHNERTSLRQINRILVNSSYFDCDFVISNNPYSHNMKYLENWESTKFQSGNIEEDNLPPSSLHLKLPKNKSSMNVMTTVIISILVTLVMIISCILIVMVLRDRNHRDNIYPQDAEQKPQDSKLISEEKQQNP